MFKAIHFYKGNANRVKPGSKARGGFTWLECSNPSKNELRKLAKTYDIRLSALEDSLDKHERARVHSRENHHAIIFKVPHANTGLETDSVGIFWAGSTVITVHRGSLPKAAEIVEHGKDVDDPLRFIHLLLEMFTGAFFGALEGIEEDMEKLEVKVIKISTKTHTQEVLRLRKSLIYFYKALIANREVLVAIKEGRLFVVNKKSSVRFSDIYNDTSQLIDLVTIHSEVLASIMETDQASTSNALGDIMKRLTVIASFALVPTLIASIYGMNFRPNSPWNMPELDWFLGYPFSLGLMTFSVLGMYYYFKKKEWL